MGLLDEQEVEQGISRYTKITKDGIRIRLLGKPLTGHSVWIQEEDKSKPVRTNGDASALPPDKDGNPPSQFWAFKVYNFTTKQVEVFETTLKTVMGRLKSLDEDEEYGGDVSKLNLRVKKTGSGRDTKYEVDALPDSTFPEEVIHVCRDECKKIDLQKLLKGESPFADEDEGKSSPPPAATGTSALPDSEDEIEF